MPQVGTPKGASAQCQERPAHYWSADFQPSPLAKNINTQSRSITPKKSIPHTNFKPKSWIVAFNQAEKLSPQEQLALALGFENLKPPPIILSE